MRTIRDEDAARRPRDDEDNNEPVTFEDAVAIHATARALMVRLPSGREVWVPQSQVHDDSEVYAAGHAGKLVLIGWFARKEGLAS
jgi:hypothetical protein